MTLYTANKYNKKALEGADGHRRMTLTLNRINGHISTHNTYRTTKVPNYVTLASSNREKWPFESPVISGNSVKFKVT